jgi:hydroxyacylglutathione hydrolase
MIVKRVDAFKDNYIWLLSAEGSQYAVVVDPGDAKPVMAALQESHLQLSAILITHHHWDHCGGIQALLNHYDVPVYGPFNDTILNITHPLRENDTIDLKEIGLSFSLLEIPGHTLDHIAYVGENAVFCGDTLFTGGCGRLFEGTAQQMLNSLSKLKKLPPHTEVYCGHEYTAANLQFALTVEPENAELIKRSNQVSLARANHKATVPSLLSLELLTNPFLRTNFPAIKKAAEKYADQSLQNETEVFAVIRHWKDNFNS